MALGRKTGGRLKGTPNKATADIRALCQAHADDVIAELARLATKAESEAARVAAIKELLDRGYGKPKQPLSNDEEGELRLVHRIERVIVDPAGEKE
jgi:monomeric isocitrate dehydrogenase